MDKNKFRGLTLDTKRLIYGDKVEIGKRCWIVPRPELTESDDMREICCSIYGFVEVDPKTVGQFIKELPNGQEIYKGDVVKYHDNTSDAYLLNGESAEKTIGQINWIERRCQFMPQEIKKNHRGGHYISHWDFIENIEKIGDVHQNPKLLETQ